MRWNLKRPQWQFPWYVLGEAGDEEVVSTDATVSDAIFGRDKGSGLRLDIRDCQSSFVPVLLIAQPGPNGRILE